MVAEFGISLDSRGKLFAKEAFADDAMPPDMTMPVVIVVHGGPGLADHTETFPGLRRAVEVCRWEGASG